MKTKLLIIFTLYFCSNLLATNEHEEQVSNGAASVLEEKTFTWSNPLSKFYYLYTKDKNGSYDIIREVRDPAIIREGDTYYIVYTHYPFTHNLDKDINKPDYGSSPGIRMYSTKDFNTFKFENWLVKSSELPDDCPYKHRFWAPEIHKINNKYYLIFTADNWISPSYCPTGQNGLYSFIGVSDNVTGPYEHITYLPGGACDATLFQDGANTFAIMPKGNQQWIQKIDLSRLEEDIVALTGRTTCILSSQDQSQYPANDCPATIEGPWMIKCGGKYILFSACAYKNLDPMEYWTEAAISDNLLGPYVSYHKIYPGGHISVFTGPDNKNWFSARGEKWGQDGFAELNISPIPFTEESLLEPFALLAGTQSVTYFEESTEIKGNPIDVTMNPIRVDANGNITVLLNDGEIKAALSIYDMTGKKILSKQLVDRYEVCTDNLPKGIYFVQLIHNGKYYTCKISK